MIGAIIGDIVGSRFERANHKSTDFELFTKECHFTDDTVMTLAVAKALLDSQNNWGMLSMNTVRCMRELGLRYPRCGYGKSFRHWLYQKNPEPYNSYGNGAAMRISPVAYVANFQPECMELSNEITKVTHNHPDGIRGAQAAAMATLAARFRTPKSEIQEMIETRYYSLDFTIDDIRPNYQFDASCQGSVPQAIKAFLEADSFEETIRLAVSIGGDSDTIAAIAGGIAGAYYGVPDNLRTKALTYLPEDLRDILVEFEATYRFRTFIRSSGPHITE